MYDIFEFPVTAAAEQNFFPGGYLTDVGEELAMPAIGEIVDIHLDGSASSTPVLTVYNAINNDGSPAASATRDPGNFEVANVTSIHTGGLYPYGDNITGWSPATVARVAQVRWPQSATGVDIEQRVELGYFCTGGIIVRLAPAGLSTAARLRIRCRIDVYGYQRFNRESAVKAGHLQ